MPDAPARQRRRWAGVLASSAVVLAAHAGILEWAWQGSGHTNTAAAESASPHTISATLLAAVPVPVTMAPTPTPAPISTRPARRVVRPPSAPPSLPAREEDTSASSPPAPDPTNTAEPLDTTENATNPSPAAPAPTADDTEFHLAAASGTIPKPTSTTTAPALYAPPPGTWHYDVTGHAKGLSYQAEGRLHWQHDGQRYRVQMTLRALWLQRQQTSSGRLDAEGLHPEHFIDQARKTREIWFDPQQHTQHTGNGPPQPAPEGVQDRLSVFFQLATQLNHAVATATPTPTNWPIPVAGGADSETWHFEAQGSERQPLPAGVYDTVKFTRRPRHSSDQTVEVWLAPTLHHIPVRLRIAQSNGDVVDQRLSGVVTAPVAHP